MCNDNHNPEAELNEAALAGVNAGARGAFHDMAHKLCEKCPLFLGMLCDKCTWLADYLERNGFVDIHTHKDCPYYK